jgi:hypothetical protein
MKTTAIMGVAVVCLALGTAIGYAARQEAERELALRPRR